MFRCNLLIASVYKLVQSGAHVVQKNRHGTTSIALACGMGNLKVVRCLLKHGADPTVGHAYRDDSNAIAYALRFNRHEVLKYLLKTHSLTIQYPLLAELKHKLVSFALEPLPSSLHR